MQHGRSVIAIRLGVIGRCLHEQVGLRLGQQLLRKCRSKASYPEIVLSRLLQPFLGLCPCILSKAARVQILDREAERLRRVVRVEVQDRCGTVWDSALRDLWKVTSSTQQDIPRW